MVKINEKVLVKTPVFDVVEKAFEGTDFKPVGINAKNWVLVLVKDGTGDHNKNGRGVFHLLVKQTRWGIEGKTIEFPCGTIEEDDYSNKETIEYIKNRYSQDMVEDKDVIGSFSAAIREVKEETGIDISNTEDFEKIRWIKSFNPNPAYFNNTLTIVRVYSKKPLKEIFERRKEQCLDKDEDCVAFIAKPFDYQNKIENHAMGLIAINAD